MAFSCPVIGCEIRFSHAVHLDSHIISEQHSPCQPKKRLINMKLECSAIYVCPTCKPTKLFNNREECQSHFADVVHGKCVCPTRIGGFLCPQCFCIFSSHLECEAHMNDFMHNSLPLPFPGDGAALPLIMPLVVLQIFTQRCSAVPWSGICIQCDRKCLGPFDEKLKTRISVDETISSHVQNGHMVEAHSSRTLVDVMKSEIKKFECSSCLRLFSNCKAKNHEYDEGEIHEYLINNFQEYLLRAAIQAPSGQPQQDPHKNKRFEADQLGPLIKKVRSDVQNTGPSSTSSSHECTNLHYEDPDFTGIKHIIFVDLDNHQKFFDGLTDYLPEEVFVWGFYGGGAKWTIPRNSVVYRDATSRGKFALYPRCGTTKDAADVAICLQVGRMSEKLPKDVAFSVVSGDMAFQELERQADVVLHRKITVMNSREFTAEKLSVMIRSVTDN